ncbi:MAG: winged helix-turn-helix transcriptional regulator [Candidatus Doudnabacteria bacterium]|nr:winged helix-turn-helix transcriptional regulator [Candidatus Doudnabacteria bacterium]
MLQEIIDSKQDSSVLSFFLSAPERSFSVVEISKRLKMPNQTASRSLNKLVAVGPLKSFSKKGKKYFIINSRYKLLPEMKNFWLKSPVKYQDELFLAIKRLGDIRAAFLSGIFCGQPNLPVDLLLVGRVNLNKLSDFLKAAEKLMGQEINYSIMSVDEFLNRRDTFDKFIKDIFDYPHLMVVDELSGKKRK